MRTHDYLLGLSLLALVACNQENMPERPTPTPGAEVKFGVSLNKNDVTRTIYGEENSKGFPIYWVNGDKVLVTSPKCLNGRNTAQYEVTVRTTTQNYATSLDKTGAAGVQWGQADKADFYSVYPADKASVQGTKFSLKMPNVQRDILKLVDKDQKAYADMNACFMRAVSREVPNGSEVNLTYTPLSTAIRFTLRGPSAGVGETGSEVTISKVVLKADKPIAGDFTVDMSTAEPTVTLGSNIYNEITLYAYYASTGGNLTLKVGEQVELNAFVIPLENLAVNDNWKLEVTTDKGTVYTTSLKGISGNGKLTPGKIHRFRGDLPNLPADTTKWDPSNWMVNIPRNVYLSEISIPGSWNSLNKDFQYAADGSSTLGFSEAEQIDAIIAQYKAGARAFHIDTRWKASRYWETSKARWVYTITGLSVANGGDGRTYDMSGGKVMQDDNVTFETVLNTITSQVQPDEYMMVFCTFAQDSHEETKNGWLQAISDVCASNSKIVDGRTISANSVVGDVLDKVIVIVNCPEDPNNIENLPQGSKCLFTHTPITLDKTSYKEHDYAEGTIKNCGDPVLTMFSSQAQTMAKLDIDGNNGYDSYNRGYCPTLLERQTKSEKILDYSLKNHGSTGYEHAHWMYHGLGGYSLYKYWGNDKSADNQKKVAQTLNPWIDSKIKLMSAKLTGDQTRYYPVGLVLMNYVTDETYGMPVMLDILLLNNKFRKAYDPNKDPLDPSNNGSSSDVNSAAPGYNSGMKDNGTDAIGWTRSH